MSCSCVCSVEFLFAYCFLTRLNLLSHELGLVLSERIGCIFCSFSPKVNKTQRRPLVKTIIVAHRFF